MKREPLRIAAILLLAITLVTMSGIASTAATLLDAQSHVSCCDGDAENEADPAKGPCSTPDCPCFSCTTMILPAEISLGSCAAAEVAYLVAPVALHRFQYVAAIEYPPETV